MANVIRIKRKTTTGAPQLTDLAVGEFCINIPDETLYLKKDVTTLLSWNTGAGVGDMLTNVYDPTNVNANAFDMANMVESATNKILTQAERDAIIANTAKVSFDTSAQSAITANTAKPDQAEVQTLIDSAITSLVGGAPAALDTLNELAAALADDAAFSATITAQLADKHDDNSIIDGGEIS